MCTFILLYNTNNNVYCIKRATEMQYNKAHVNILLNYLITFNELTVIKSVLISRNTKKIYAPDFQTKF